MYMTLWVIVTLEGLDGEQITRQDDPNILTWTRHVSPYKSLPKLNSHLHPKYVIYDAGQKLLWNHLLYIRSSSMNSPFLRRSKNCTTPGLEVSPKQQRRIKHTMFLVSLPRHMILVTMTTTVTMTTLKTTTMMENLWLQPSLGELCTVWVIISNLGRQSGQMIVSGTWSGQNLSKRRERNNEKIVLIIN